jgi:hypothetical protein
VVLTMYCLVLFLLAGDSAVAGLHEQLAALMPHSQSAAAAAAQQSGSSPMQQQQQQQLSGAMQRRIQHNIQLAARCAKLESEKQQLAREKEEIQGKRVLMSCKLWLVAQRQVLSLWGSGFLQQSRVLDHCIAKHSRHDQSACCAA